MSGLFGVALLMVTLSLVVTSQPFAQQDPARHSDFIWNSRKIGNKKVATLTIRKDEERDRRSISPVEGDTTHRSAQRQHHHRHHHGEGAQAAAAMWLPNEQSAAQHEEAAPPEGTQHTGMSPPLLSAESSVEDGHRVRHNDVHPENIQGEDHMPSFPEVLEEAGITLRPSLLKTKTTSVRRGGSDGSRRRNGKKSKRNRTAKRNKNNKNKRKKKKGCRRLKGVYRRKCLAALRQCSKFRRRRKKQCRADAIQKALNEASGRREEPDIFSFLKNMTEMRGKEACHYHHLKNCSAEVGLFTEFPHSDEAVVKCHFRKKFLECMLNFQQHGSCDTTFHMRGDMSTLRKKIKEFVWTPSSCLISNVVEG